MVPGRVQPIIAPTADPRLVVGCMSGTSLDGLDTALVEIHGTGLTMSVRLLDHADAPLHPLDIDLRRFAEQAPMEAARIAQLTLAFAQRHAACIKGLLAGRRAHLVAVHGQTVYHAPPLSWQLFSPAALARACGAPVVCDMRAADLAAGGQGAPITPLADYVIFRAAERRAVVNLGGFANFTLLPATATGAEPAALEQIDGGDICVCNQLLDRCARELLARPYDADGARALRGTVIPDARAALLELLAAQAAARRSLGTGDELALWLARFRAAHDAADILRTACAAIGETIAARLGPVDRVLLAGGGARNGALRAAIAGATAAPVELTDAHGLPGAAREAAEMAVLGALCADGVPITLPRVTRVPPPAPLAGVWAFPPHPSG